MNRLFQFGSELKHSSERQYEHPAT